MERTCYYHLVSEQICDSSHTPYFCSWAGAQSRLNQFLLQSPLTCLDDQYLVWVLWRMEEAVATEVVKHSGQKGDDFRFFAGPMKWGVGGWQHITTDYKTEKRDSWKDASDKL